MANFRLVSSRDLNFTLSRPPWRRMCSTRIARARATASRFIDAVRSTDTSFPALLLSLRYLLQCRHGRPRLAEGSLHASGGFHGGAIGRGRRLDCPPWSFPPFEECKYSPPQTASPTETHSRAPVMAVVVSSEGRDLDMGVGMGPFRTSKTTASVHVRHVLRPGPSRFTSLHA